MESASKRTTPTEPGGGWKERQEITLITFSSQIHLNYISVWCVIVGLEVWPLRTNSDCQIMLNTQEAQFVSTPPSLWITASLLHSQKAQWTHILICTLCTVVLLPFWTGSLIPVEYLGIPEATFCQVTSWSPQWVAMHVWFGIFGLDPVPDATSKGIYNSS